MKSTRSIALFRCLSVFALWGCRSTAQEARPRVVVRAALHDAGGPADASSREDGGAERASAPDASSALVASEPSIEHELEPAIETCERPRTLPLPVVPAEIASDVQRYRAIVRRTARCYHSFFRVRMRAPAQCEQWFRALDQGGPAAMHAIGVELTTAEPGEYSCRTPYISAALSRLARSIARWDDPAAALYLMRAVSFAVAYGPEYSDDAEWKAYEGLLHLAGGDVQSRVPPIADRYPGVATEREARADGEPGADVWPVVLNSWARYYLAHRSEPPSQWRARNLPATRRALSIDGGYPAFVAAMVLWERPDDRPAVRALFERAIRTSAHEQEPTLASSLTGLASERRVTPNRWTFRWQ